MLEKFSDILQLYEAQQLRIKAKARPFVSDYSPIDYLSAFTLTDIGLEDTNYRLLCMQLAKENLTLFKEYYENWSIGDLYESYFWMLSANFNPNI